MQFLKATDAADVEAICAQIVPSGATPGAREARAVYFIDTSLSTYFSEMAPDYRQGSRPSFRQVSRRQSGDDVFRRGAQRDADGLFEDH